MAEIEAIVEPGAYNGNSRTKTILLSETQYEAMVNGLSMKCKQWIKGDVAGPKLVLLFHCIREKNWEIEELQGKPDDYDWDTVANLVCRGEELKKKFRTAHRMMVAVTNAVELQPSDSQETTLTRAYNFTVCFQKQNGNVEMLSHLEL